MVWLFWIRDDGQSLSPCITLVTVTVFAFQWSVFLYLMTPSDAQRELLLIFIERRTMSFPQAGKTHSDSQLSSWKLWYLVHGNTWGNLNAWKVLSTWRKLFRRLEESKSVLCIMYYVLLFANRIIDYCQSVDTKYHRVKNLTIDCPQNPQYFLEQAEIKRYSIIYLKK